MNEWLVHLASKGAVVLGVSLMAGLVLRRMAAARRYAVWLTAVMALGVLPLAVVMLPAWRVLPKMVGEAGMVPLESREDAAGKVSLDAEAMPMPHFEAEPAGARKEGSVDGRMGSPAMPRMAVPMTQEVGMEKSAPSIEWHKMVMLLPWAWVGGVALLLGRLGWAAWRLHRLEKNCVQGMSAALDEAVLEMRLQRAPRLLIGEMNAVPMVWGVWRKRLLLPEGFAEWPKEKLRSVLLHELAHLKRRDPLALWAAQWVKALHWFNPLVWLTMRQLRADQERACDDRVLRQGVRASDYAQHLLDLSRHTRVAPGLALCALTITRCSPVEARVKAILDVRRSREGLTRRWLLGLAGVALMATAPVAMLHAIEAAKLRGKILDRNGVVLAESTAESTAEKVRHYPLQTLTAHVVGYTGKTGPEDATPMGRIAMEKRQDAVLRQGQNVTLTLDARIQRLTTQAMQDGGIQRGAAVVMDPQTGEILAAVSLPSYDANWFVPTLPIERFDKLVKDGTKPLLNRCFSSEYPPGAAFMPFTALAGLAAGVGTPTYVCAGSVTYGARSFPCWKGVRDQAGHGALNPTEALAQSCNCYWYRFGNQAGLKAFEKLAPAVGLGQRYGLDEQGKAGDAEKFAFVHGTAQKATEGDVANISIGQGRVLLTPLQMTVLAATMANGGKVPEPKLVRDDQPVQWRAEVNVEAGQMEKIREGMKLAVNGDKGTGKTTKSEKVVIAAKTGTAQWRMSKDQNLAVMIGFAPYDKPTLAFAVLHEGATAEAVSGGKNCGPVVKRIVEEALALPPDGSGEVSPVKEVMDARTKPEDAKQALAAWVSEMNRELNLARDALGGDLYFKEVKAEAGQVLIVGEAGRMEQVIQFRDKLTKLGKRWDMEWVIPVPMPTEDGKRVQFRVQGTSRRATVQEGSVQAAPTAPGSMVDHLKSLTDALAKAGLITKELDARLMVLVEKASLLAELPKSARVQVLTGSDMQGAGALPVFYFRFTGSREEVNEWLLASLSEKRKRSYANLLKWPDAPMAFDRCYLGMGGSQIIIHSKDGKTIEVMVAKQNRAPMIAPNEEALPRSKTADA